MKIINKVVLIIFFLAACFFSTKIINRINIYPSEDELKGLRLFLGDIEIKNEKDIFLIQNKIVTEIRHKFLSSSKINILNNLSRRQGYCFDRSLILQKIMFYNKIEFRPVYIFYRFDGNKTSFFDFFKKNIGSHNIFEFKWKGNWYVMKTNSKMNTLMSLNTYLHSGLVPINSCYILHLNNRNGIFIDPSWVPDVY